MRAQSLTYTDAGEKECQDPTDLFWAGVTMEEISEQDPLSGVLWPVQSVVFVASINRCVLHWYFLLI